MEERVLVQGRDSWVAVMSGMVFLVGVFFCCWSGGALGLDQRFFFFYGNAFPTVRF